MKYANKLGSSMLWNILAVNVYTSTLPFAIAVAERFSDTISDLAPNSSFSCAERTYFDEIKNRKINRK